MLYNLSVIVLIERVYVSGFILYSVYWFVWFYIIYICMIYTYTLIYYIYVYVSICSVSCCVLYGCSYCLRFVVSRGMYLYLSLIHI